MSYWKAKVCACEFSRNDSIMVITILDTYAKAYNLQMYILMPRSTTNAHVMKN